MNRDEARYILRAYHLGGQDASDVQFREALEMLKHDPVLAAWFAQEREFDARFSEKFRAFPVPTFLKAQLLAARKVIPLRSWWRRPAWISAAAACALLAILAVGLLRSPGPPEFSAFRSYAVDASATLDHLDVMSSNLDDLRRWLHNGRAPGDFTIPAGLTGRPSLGCRIFDWKGQHVSLVCFKLANGHVVHLFVMDRTTLRNVPSGNTPQLALTSRGIVTASWSTGQCVYVLTSHGDERELQQLL